MKDFYIVGEITQLTAREFVEFLQEAKNGEMTLHINSGGGDIFSALAISNLIKNKKVTVKVEGLAASAATLILCGAAKVVSAKNALFMMHLPLVEMDSSYNAEELAKLQRSLEAIKGAVVETYLQKLKIDAAAIEEMLIAEEWQDAASAREIGLVDEISEEEIAIKLSADRKILYVGKAEFRNMKMPEVAKLEEEKKENSTAIMGKFKNSILTAERLRYKNLNSLKNGTAEVEILIEDAVDKGLEFEEVKKLVDKITAVQNKTTEPKIKNLDELYKMLSDNLKSGAADVTASGNAKSDNLTQYLNEALGKVK